MTAHEWFCEYLRLLGSQNVGSMWQCPAHADAWPSLSVSKGAGDRLLLHCFGGCSTATVLEALSLTSRSMFEAHIWSPEKAIKWLRPTCTFAPMAPPAGKSAAEGGGSAQPRGSRLSTEYHYYTSEARFVRTRYEYGPKKCHWESWDGYCWRPGGVKPTELVLYAPMSLGAAKEGDAWIVLCESESSVDALNAAGIYAATWAGGADSPRIPALRAQLSQSRILWVPDHDEAGLRCGRTIERELRHCAKQWATVVGDPGEDARDLLVRGVITQDLLDALP